MKTILSAILGLSFVFASCANSKSGVPSRVEQIAKYSEKEDRAEPLKRHNRW